MLRCTSHILTLLFHHWFRGAAGCSFIVANHNLSSVYSPRQIAEANAYSKSRGPDATKVAVVEDWTFLHNLLSMTGSFTMQPFVQAPPTQGQEKVTSSGHVSVVFNGEIYNYRQLALELTGNEEAFASDGFALLPAYERWGMEMVRHFEGEFAIVLVDFRLRRVLLSADAFSTKPLYYAAWHVDNTKSERRKALRFVAASYESVLRGLGAPSVTHRRALQNEALVLDLDRPQAEPISRIQLITWDLRQHKDHTRDWQAAFARAVRLRTERLKHRVFIGLSSGYDTGAIMLALKQQRQPFLAYAIRAHEPMQVVDARAAACEGIGETTIIPLNASTYAAQRGWLRRHAESFRHRLSDGTTIDNLDRGAIGLSTILTYSHRRGLVFLTGNGADEIISDYAKNGKKIFPHSCFNGIFPSNLSTAGFFPSSAADKKARYCSFYGSSNKAYLMLVEMTGGAHGVEARYPFLDPKVVQEFLWLTAKVKNSEYKRPIADFLRSGNFPNAWGIKHGFTARPDDNTDAQNASGRVSSFGNVSYVGNISAPCCTGRQVVLDQQRQLCLTWASAGWCRSKPIKTAACSVACGRCKMCRGHNQYDAYALFYNMGNDHASDGEIRPSAGGATVDARAGTGAQAGAGDMRSAGAEAAPSARAERVIAANTTVARGAAVVMTRAAAGAASATAWRGVAMAAAAVVVVAAAAVAAVAAVRSENIG